MTSVRYLNARPLVYGIEDEVTFCEPSRVADLLYRGQFDIGLVPVAEVLLHDRYDILDGLAIAARGAVQSVFMTHRPPLEKIRRVAVTTASRSSVWLLRVLLKVGYAIEPEFYPAPRGATLGEHEALLLIGDDALWHRHHRLEPRDHVLDLGHAWADMTCLPFVFAVWAGTRGAFTPEVAQRLHRAAAAGLSHFKEIAEEATVGTLEYRLHYLRSCVWYGLGPAEREGLRRFQQYACELGLVERKHELRFVS
jgi:chorismate dehydratase